MTAVTCPVAGSTRKLKEDTSEYAGTIEKESRKVILNSNTMVTKSIRSSFANDGVNSEI